MTQEFLIGPVTDLARKRCELCGKKQECVQCVTDMVDEETEAFPAWCCWPCYQELIRGRVAYRKMRKKRP